MAAGKWPALFNFIYTIKRLNCKLPKGPTRIGWAKYMPFCQVYICIFDPQVTLKNLGPQFCFTLAQRLSLYIPPPFHSLTDGQIVCNCFS